VALLLAGGVAPAQEGEGKEKGKPSDEERAARRELLKQRLYGHDRADRSRAAWEAMKADEFDEAFWLSFMDTRFPTVDEQEEAKELAAHALVSVGTERCLPRLLELMEEEPKCFTTEQQGGKEVRMVHHAFREEAALAYHSITMELSWARVMAAVAGKSPDEQGDILLGMYIDGQSAYDQVRVEGAPEELPVYWRGGLTAAAGELGPAGARAFARAIARTDDVDLRVGLCLRAFEAFGWSRVEAYLKDHPEVRQKLKSGEITDAEVNRTAIRAQPEYEGLREGVKEILVAILHRNPVSKQEMFPFWLLVPYDLTELEEELITFIRSRDWDTNPYLRSLSSSKRNDYYSCTSEAYNALLDIGSETAIDFVVGWPGRTLAWATRDSHPERTLPKLMAAIVREREAPWERHFSDLFGHMSSYKEYVDRQMLQVLEETLQRMREIAARIDEGDPRRKSTEWVIDRLERDIEDAKERLGREGR
jgi:hypothetical protein